MKFSARDYRMPRYKEIPNVGLYLEQTVKYINECLAPIEISITPSMLSNYVKKGYIDRPVKKQYYADQIAYAIYIVIIKQVLSMDNIASLFVLQKATYTLPVAYDYFCSELEKTLVAIFEDKEEPLLTLKGDNNIVIYKNSKYIEEGYVANELRGNNGFGFDEIFELENGKTLAELTQDEKNEISARKIALEQIKKEINNL